LGVENSLYPLIASLEQEGDSEIVKECRELLKEEATLDDLLSCANSYLSSELVTATRDFASWPQHNKPEQQEYMLNSSAKLIGMNAEGKEIICAVLSRGVFRGVGKLMFDSSWDPQAPLFWLNHDVIAKRLTR